MKIFEILNIIGIICVAAFFLLSSHIAPYWFFLGLFIGFLLMIPYELKNYKNDSKNANANCTFLLMQKKWAATKIILCIGSLIIFLILLYEQRKV